MDTVFDTPQHLRLEANSRWYLQEGQDAKNPQYLQQQTETLDYASKVVQDLRLDQKQSPSAYDGEQQRYNGKAAVPVDRGMRNMLPSLQLSNTVEMPGVAGAGGRGVFHERGLIAPQNAEPHRSRLDGARNVPEPSERVLADTDNVSLNALALQAMAPALGKPTEVRKTRNTRMYLTQPTQYRDNIAPEVNFDITVVNAGPLSVDRENKLVMLDRSVPNTTLSNLVVPPPVQPDALAVLKPGIGELDTSTRAVRRLVRRQARDVNTVTAPIPEHVTASTDQFAVAAPTSAVANDPGRRRLRLRMSGANEVRNTHANNSIGITRFDPMIVDDAILHSERSRQQNVVGEATPAAARRRLERVNTRVSAIVGPAVDTYIF
jgi:hypothetical protein